MSQKLKRKAGDTGSAVKKSKLDEPQSSSTVGTPSIFGKRKLSPSDNGNNGIPPIKESDIFANEPSEYSSLIGLKLPLHGTILKLLILFLQRGLDKGYYFRLAAEMDAAEKFDDLVLQYAKKDATGTIVKDDQGNPAYVYRLLQAKSKQNENKQITYNDLSTENTYGEFSLPKYFTSYRKIMQKPEFKGVKDFILFTNINFDIAKLKAKRIDVEEITGLDDFLDMKNEKKSIRYKLIVDDTHELYGKLKATSDLDVLAKALVEHICDKKQIDLTRPIFRCYHIALLEEKVIVIKAKGKNEYIGKFHEKFISYNIQDPNDPGLSESAKNLRKILQKHLETKGLSVDKDIEMNLSRAFCKGLDPDPQLTSIEEFTQELVSLIKDAKAGEEVIVSPRKKIIRNNIDKLAGHVLVKKDNKVQCSLTFLDVNSNLRGNLEDFRKKFIEALSKEMIDFNTLSQYQFKIDGFYTCEEEQLHLKLDYIDNKEIKDFFDVLVFAVNQPNEVELSEIIKDEIGAAYKLKDSDCDLFVANIQKEMMDWFKDKGVKGKEGRFFSYKDGKELFTSTKRKIAQSKPNTTKEHNSKISDGKYWISIPSEFNNTFEYDKDDILGHGSCSVVYKGKFSARTVAVKKIDLEKSYDISQSNVKNFKEVFENLKEFREIIGNMCADDDNHVITFYDYSIELPYIYLALQHCLGTLEDFLNEKRDFSGRPEDKKPSLVDLLLGAVKGLNALHQKGYIHRDITPKNILISNRTGHFMSVISDFGHCKELEENLDRATLSRIVGKQGWTSPEIVRWIHSNKQEREKITYGIETDIFSLGCVYAYALTFDTQKKKKGQHPFGEKKDERKNNILYGTIKKNYDLLKELRYNYEMFNLINTMINFEATKRPTAKAVEHHAFFWNNEKKYEFLKIANGICRNDQISTETIQLQFRNDLQTDSPYKDWIQIIEDKGDEWKPLFNFFTTHYTPKNKKQNINPPKSKKKKPPNNKKKEPPYDRNLLIDLLRAIRNLKVHQFEHTIPGLEPFTSSHCEKVFSAFPKLIMYLYKKFFKIVILDSWKHYPLPVKQEFDNLWCQFYQAGKESELFFHDMTY